MVADHVRSELAVGPRPDKVLHVTAQVLVEFAASDQPPLGFPLAPVMSVAASDGLHRLIEDEFDAAGAAPTVELWARVGQIYSGVASKSEVRDPTIFAIPRLMRTM